MKEKRIQRFQDSYALALLLSLLFHHIYPFSYALLSLLFAFLFLLPIYGLKLLKATPVSPKDTLYLYILTIPALLTPLSFRFPLLANLFFFLLLLSFLFQFPLFIHRRPLLTYSLLGLLGIAALLLD